MSQPVRAVLVLLALLAAATPVHGLPSALSLVRSPAGPVPAGTTIRVTATVTNSSTTDELVDIDLQGVFGDPLLAYVGGSISTGYRELDAPAGTVLVGDQSGDTSFHVDLAPVPPSWHAEIHFDMRVGAAFPADDEEVVFTINYLDGSLVTRNPLLIPVVAEPELELFKNDADQVFRPGGRVTYGLIPRNVGSQEAVNLTLSDTVPDHLRFIPTESSPGWSCSPDDGPGSTCSLTFDSLAPGGGTEVFTFTLAYPVATVPARLEELRNVASVRDDGSQSGGTVQSDLALERTPVVAVPDLVLGLSDGGTTAAADQVVSYAVELANRGDQDATGVTVQAIVPEHARFAASASSAGWSCADGALAGSTCVLPVGALAADASFSATFAVRVDASVPAGADRLLTSATASDDGAGGAEPTPADNRATEDTPLDATARIELTKTDDGANASPRDTVGYHLTVINSGTRDALDVVVVESVPDGARFAAGASTAGWSCPDASTPGTRCTLAVGSLAAGSSRSAVFAVTVDRTLPAGLDELVNTATAGDDGGDPVDATATETTPLDATPDLALTKDDGGVRAGAGDVVAYRLAYTNRGSQGATGVVLRETVPDHARFAAGASTSGWTCSPDASAGTTCILAVGDLAAGASGDATFAVRVADALPAAADRLVNTAEIADDGANGPDPTAEDTTATDDTPLDAEPRLELTKSADPAVASPGELVTYTLTLANGGTREALDVVVTETVPQSTELVAAASDPGWSCSDGAPGGTGCTLSLGPLAAGASRTAVFAVRLADPVAAGVERITNTATAGDGGGDPADDEAGTETPVDATPDLGVTKTDADAVAAPGERIVYTLQVTNAGSQDAVGVELVETVPVNTSFEPAASDGRWSCDGSGGAGTTCILALGAVPGGGGGESVTFAVRVDSSVAAGVEEIVNTVNVADDGSQGADPTPDDNEATERTPLTAVGPDLSIRKTDGGITAGPGEGVVYTLRYANRGSVIARAVELTETVPERSRFDAGSSDSRWTCDAGGGPGRDCTLPLGDLPPAASGEIRFAVTAVDALSAGESPDPLHNIAAIADDGSAGADLDPSDNRDVEETPLAGFVPDLSVTKTDGDATTAPGQVLIYTVTAANLGTRGATGVELVEIVPEHSAFDAGASDPRWSCSAAGAAGDTCTLAQGSLPAGGDGDSVAFAVRVADALPEEVLQLVNTVSVRDDGSAGPDGDTTNNLASELTPVEPVDGPGPGDPGDPDPDDPDPDDPGPDDPDPDDPGPDDPDPDDPDPDDPGPGDPGPGDPTPAPLLDATQADLLGHDADGDGAFDPGDSIRYSVRITNDGAAAGLDLVYRVPVPTHTRLVPDAVTAPGGTVTSGGGAGDALVAVRLGRLEPGESAALAWEVEILSDLAPGVEEIVSQGTLLSANHVIVDSDDPDTFEVDDPTRTPVDRSDGGPVAPVDVPVLGPLGGALLALLLFGLAARSIRARRDGSAPGAA